LLSELRRSIQSVLYERIASPLSGAFALSWVFWNWRILYFLIESDARDGTVLQRIAVLQDTLINLRSGFLYPAATSIVLVVLYPFASTAAYWVWLRFKSWQRALRNQVERRTLLSIEESIELRLELQRRDDRIQGLLSEKSREIERVESERDQAILQLQEVMKEREQLLSQFNEISRERRKKAASTEATSELSRDEQSEEEFRREFQTFLGREDIAGHFELILDRIRRHLTLGEKSVPGRVLMYYILNDIIIKSGESVQGQYYELTEKGKAFGRWYIDRPDTAHD